MELFFEETKVPLGVTSSEGQSIPMWLIACLLQLGTAVWAGGMAASE